jgi:hypothetical protein
MGRYREFREIDMVLTDESGNLDAADGVLLEIAV